MAHLMVRLRLATRAGRRRTVVHHTDTSVYEVVLSRSTRRTGSTTSFAFSSSAPTGENSFRYYQNTAQFPSEGDVYVHFWELDSWEQSSRRVRFSEWFHHEDETDGRSGGNTNEYLGTLRGFVRRQRNAYDFICTDPSGITQPSQPTQPSLTLRYKTISGGQESFVERSVLMTGEFEATWELGIIISSNSQPSGDTDYTNRQFGYPILFVDSIKNLVRLQIEEGGLTVANYSRLLSDGDDDTRTKHKHFNDQLIEQLDSGTEQALTFLQSQRSRVPTLRSTNSLPVLSTTEEQALWDNIEKELRWQRERAYYILNVSNRSGGSTPLSWLEPTAKHKRSWKNTFDRWRRRRRRGRQPTLIVKKKQMKHSFDEWNVRLTTHIPVLRASTSSTNLINYFRTQFGLTATIHTLTTEQENHGNVCGVLELQAIERAQSASVRIITPTVNTIHNLYNDVEFPRNSRALSTEFGFLALSESGNDIIKGAKLIGHYNDIPNYLNLLRTSIRTNFTALCDALRVSHPYSFDTAGLPKIFRYIIFTHGSRSSGLKFRPDLSSTTSAIHGVWLSKTVLNSANGTTFINNFSQHLCSQSVITLFACSTGGSSDPTRFRLTSCIRQMRQRLQNDTNRRNRLVRGRRGLRNRLRHNTSSGEELRDIITLGDSQRRKIISTTAYSGALTDRMRQMIQLGGTHSLLSDQQRTDLRSEITRLQTVNRRIIQEIRRMRGNNYAKNLLKYGGDPQILSETTCQTLQITPPTTYPDRLRFVSCLGLRNTMGEGSFAQLLRDKLTAGGVSADVWSHTDAGHTSRNSRLRLFDAYGGVHDLVRMIFNMVDYPSENQLNFWWNRGGNRKPMEHQHAVKKAALCAYASRTDSQCLFSLARIIEDFRSWSNL